MKYRYLGGIMSGNSNEKKPHGWLFKNFIGGMIFSYLVWVALIIFYDKNGGDLGIPVFVLCAFAIIPGIIGAIGYVLVKLWQDWLYSHFVFFTRINPFTIFLFRYIIYPALGCVVAPFVVLLLVLNLMGKA